MYTYLTEAGVTYRHLDHNSIVEPEEIASTYFRFHQNGNVGEFRVATFKRSDIYKLVNHWNRENRIQKTNWYYEAL